MDRVASRMRLKGWALRSGVLQASRRKRRIPRRKEAAEEIHLNLRTLWLKSSSENATTKAKMMASWVNTRPYTWNCNILFSQVDIKCSQITMGWMLVMKKMVRNFSRYKCDLSDEWQSYARVIKVANWVFFLASSFSIGLWFGSFHSFHKSAFKCSLQASLSLVWVQS